MTEFDDEFIIRVMNNLHAGSYGTKWSYPKYDMDFSRKIISELSDFIKSIKFDKNTMKIRSSHSGWFGFICCLKDSNPETLCGMKISYYKEKMKKPDFSSAGFHVEFYPGFGDDNVQYGYFHSIEDIRMSDLVKLGLDKELELKIEMEHLKTIWKHYTPPVDENKFFYE